MGTNILLFIFGLFFILPMLFIITNAFKPLDELFIFPPRFFVTNPTLNNFSDLFILMSNSWIPFSRYIFNTFFITIVGTFGHVIISSLAAFIVAKVHPPFSEVFFKLVIITLMFSSAVTAIPNFIVLSKLGWIDTYASLIIPAWGGALGLFLMKQFIDGVPEAMIEAARIDGAGLLHTFWKIVMPNVKPGWITLIIFSFQGLWGATGGVYIYSEKLKPLPYALNQILGGGLARTGVGAAIALLLMIVPITLFIITQSNIIETMASSGIKE